MPVTQCNDEYRIVEFAHQLPRAFEEGSAIFDVGVPAAVRHGFLSRSISRSIIRLNLFNGRLAHSKRGCAVFKVVGILATVLNFQKHKTSRGYESLSSEPPIEIFRPRVTRTFGDAQSLCCHIMYSVK